MNKHFEPLASLSQEELQKMYNETSKKIEELHMALMVGQLKTTHQIDVEKKKRARITTALSQLVQEPKSKFQAKKSIK